MSVPVSDEQTDVILDEPSAGASAGCDMCPHPLAVHDAIALRYCAASASSALSRGCMCRPPV